MATPTIEGLASLLDSEETEDEKVMLGEDEGEGEEKGEGEGTKTGDEDKSGEEEKGEEEAAGQEEEVEEAEKSGEEEAGDEEEAEAGGDELGELRSIIRKQTREMAVMREQLKRLTAPKQQKKSDLSFLEEEEDEEGEGEEKVELSEIELLQQDIKQTAEQRGPILETLVETMELNDKYSDLRKVCTQSNFDDMFEAIGLAVAEKEGIDPVIAALKAEAEIWKLPNPYKYMYDVIKKFHPSFKGKEGKGDADKGKGKSENVTVVKAPSSVAGMGGGSGKSAGAWTAKRIDDLPEDELDKVPEDVYEKYLAGELK